MAAAGVELQDAIYSALTGDATLMAAVNGVFDHVPDDYGSFPYVTIGEDSLVQWDTDKKTGFDGSITIHVWSRYQGRREVKTIQGHIYDVLHNATLVYNTHDSVLCQQRDMAQFMDPDGDTRHGVQTFNVLMQKR